MLMNWLLRVADPLPLALLWSTPRSASSRCGAALHRRLFATGFTKAQEGAERFVARQAVAAVPSASCSGGCPSPSGSSSSRTSGSSSATPPSGASSSCSRCWWWSTCSTSRRCRCIAGSGAVRLRDHSCPSSTWAWRGSCSRPSRRASFSPSVSLEGRQMWLLRSSPLDLRRDALEQVLGGDGAAAGARAGHHHPDQPSAAGERRS